MHEFCRKMQHSLRVWQLSKRGREKVSMGLSSRWQGLVFRFGREQQYHQPQQKDA